MELIFPNHVAIIPDGSRRYAKKAGIELERAYWLSIQNVAKCVEWLIKGFHTPSISVYALSYENVVKRKNIEEISKLLAKMFNIWREGRLFHELGVRVKFCGEMSLFPKFYQKSARRLEEATKKYYKHRFYILSGYSGNLEIAKTAKKFSSDEKGERLVERFIKKLEIPEPVDLLIRTGGDHRISNCLPFQITYAELLFLDIFFPEVTKGDIEKVINEFLNRKRRFGK